MICKPWICSVPRRPALVWGALVIVAVWSSIPLDAGVGPVAIRVENPQTLKARAEKLFDNRKYAEALECYAKLKTFPRLSSTALIGSARCHQKLGHHEPALKALDVVISREPRNAYAHYCRGHSYFAKEEFDKAKTDYSASIEAAPRVGRYYHARAAAYFGLGDFVRSLADYDTGLRLDPRNAGAFAARGLVFNELRQFDRALSDFSRALEIDPRRTDAFGARAQTYIHLRKWRLAVNDLKIYSEKHPKDSELLLFRAMLHVKLREIEDAIQLCTQAIGLDGNVAKPYVHRADNYCRIGDFKTALLDYQRAAKIAEGLIASVHSRLALFYAMCPDKQLRDHDAALKHAKKCCELTKRRKWSAVAVLAIVHQKAGRLQEAKRCQEEALRIAPANAKKQARERMERWFQRDDLSVDSPFTL